MTKLRSSNIYLTFLQFELPSFIKRRLTIKRINIKRIFIEVCLAKNMSLADIPVRFDRNSQLSVRKLILI
jgi:hypothetical protein